MPAVWRLSAGSTQQGANLRRRLNIADPAIHHVIATVDERFGEHLAAVEAKPQLCGWRIPKFTPIKPINQSTAVCGIKIALIGGE